MSIIKRVSYGEFSKDIFEEKFVQVKVRGRDFLKVGMNNFEECRAMYHADILKEFLTEFSLSFQMREDGRGPLNKGLDYELVGAGLCCCMDDPNIHIFGLESELYGIATNRESLVALIECFPRGIEIYFYNGESMESLGIGGPILV